MNARARAQRRNAGDPIGGTSAGTTELDLTREEAEGAVSIAEPHIEAPARPATGPIAPVTAMLRYPMMFFVIALVVVLAAGAIAYQRAPLYTSEARLIVGQVDVESRAVPGFTAAAASLASIYSRVVATDAVAGPAAGNVGLDVSEVRGSISASPIPDSSIIRVEATSDDEGRATQLAGAAATALSEYVQTLNRADPYATPLFKGYQDAATAFAQAQVAESVLQQQLNGLNTPTSPLALAAGEGLEEQILTTQGQLVAAKSATLQAQLKANQASTAFQNATRGVGDTAEVNLIAPAASQGSDRRSNLELALLVGLVGGLLVALAAVTLRANRRYLRQLRREARRVA